MVDPKKEPQGIKLPDRVARIMDDSHREPLTRLVSEMDDQDITMLKRIVAREVNVPKDIRLYRVMSALVDREKSGDVKTLLSKVVADSSEAARNRLSAANQLGRFQADMVEDDLIGHLSVADPFVRARLIRSIGALGGNKSLDALDRVPKGTDPHLDKQLAFSKALISHRLGLDRNDLPVIGVKELQPGDEELMTDMSFRKTESASVQSRLSSLQGGNFGIGLSETLGYDVSCGKTNWSMFVNQELQDEALFARIRERKYISALLSYHEQRTGTFAVQYIMLTNPKPGGIGITLARQDGELVYTGTATAESGQIQFRMSDVERKGSAPTYLTGRFSLAGIAMDACVPYAARENKRVASPMV